MKTKIVLWGTTETDEKVLVAIELIESENLVRTYVFEEAEATEIFYNRMLNEWRYDTQIEFPESTKIIDKQLTLSEDILPEGIKIDRPDLIIRAKTEWHFVVLSKKLYDLYNTELEDFKEKINELTEFDNGVWEELKGFWSKVQTQISEKNLFSNHIDSLRKETDEAFRQLKDLKKHAEKELREESKKHYAHFAEILDKIEEKIEGGMGLQPIFDELKEIQNKFKKTSFSRDHRKQLWDRIDHAFKAIKEKRFGNNPEERSPLARLTRRYEGLLNAIDKMEKSIARDKKEMNQQDKRASSSFGQLEMEIRKVKMSMVEERVQSKEEKLQDMLKTKSMLENRMQAESSREEKRKQFEEAKKEAEEKIAQEIQERSEELEKNQDELLKAAEKISEAAQEEKTEAKQKAEPKQKKKSLIDKISDKLEDMVEEAKDLAEDAIDTIKATAEVLEDKAEDQMEKLEDKMEELETKTGPIREKIAKAADKLEDQLEETIKKVKTRVKENLKKEEEE